MEDFVIGLALALSSCLLIGASYILKKKALIRLGKAGLRANEGGYGYLKDGIWWAGLLLMGLGEALNFAAYAFAPAMLVTPLGALSVLFSNILASRFMGDHVNLLGKIGGGLCLLGSTIVVFHSPKEQELNSVDEIGAMLLEPSFTGFAMTVIAATAVLIFYHAPRYGKTNAIVYVGICSLLGSFTVLGCKAIGIALKQTFGGGANELANWVTWFFIAELIICVSIQMNYLNKALDTFSVSIVSPIFYVCFTTSVIVGSAILFKEWTRITMVDMVGSLSGFLVIVAGIFLLNAFKDLRISLSDLSPLSRQPIGADRDNKVHTTPLLPTTTPSKDKASLFNHTNGRASPMSSLLSLSPLGGRVDDDGYEEDGVSTQSAISTVDLVRVTNSSGSSIKQLQHVQPTDDVATSYLT